MKYYLIDKEGKESILDTTKEELNGCIMNGHRFGFNTDEILVKQNDEKFGIVRTEKEYIGNMTLQEIVDNCKRANDIHHCEICKFKQICDLLYEGEPAKYWSLYI